MKKIFTKFIVTQLYWKFYKICAPFNQMCPYPYT